MIIIIIFCFFRVFSKFSLVSKASNKFLRNALGSVAAGIVAGYFSHIPHNLSTMKLLAPHISYKEHFNTLIVRAEEALPIALPSKLMKPLGLVRTLFMPQGFVIRSTQIIGSFVILNGVSHLMDVRLWGNQDSHML